MSRKFLVKSEIPFEDLDLPEYAVNKIASLPGIDLSYEVEISYSPGRPARVWGPPELCYPADPPEWETAEYEEDVAFFLAHKMPELDSRTRLQFINAAVKFLEDEWTSDGFDEKVEEVIANYDDRDDEI